MTDAFPKPAERPGDETIKETIESIVIAFILAFVFRAYVVEAFVIPTGSMAPTLLGAHVHVRCDQCGYQFDFDPPENALKEQVSVGGQQGVVMRSYLTVPDGRRDAVGAVCPMCLFPNTLPRGTPLSSGDRILVHKYIYSFSEPRRWDVVVFKAPHEPSVNYIKRLVGLPNEQMYIFEGNLYVRPTDGDGRVLDDAWRIARKTDRPEVQRAVWRPLYHSDYIPLDQGHRSFDPRYNWSVPWTPDDGEASSWQIENRRSYHYGGDGTSTIRFEIPGAVSNSSPVIYPYNQRQYDETRSPGLSEPIEDVRIAARVEPLAAGVGVAFATTARLDNEALEYGIEQLVMTLSDEGELLLEAVDPSSDHRRLLAREQVDPLKVGRDTLVELWYADQQASVWLDGERVLVWEYSLGLAELQQRERPSRKPDISLTVSGGAINLHDVQVDRDLYYSNRLESGTLARGGLLRNRAQRPLELGQDEFFCVGDNGPRSSDSRYWEHVNPWIRERMLPRRREPGVDAAGIVPRDLMMGRAFFVYFPAPYSFGRIPLPNFGEMRFIH